MPDILSVRDVVRTFGSVRAVDGISFTVRRGTITGLLGRNGAGENDHDPIRMITGIFHPDSGSIDWRGARIGSGFRDVIGYIPEERRLYASKLSSGSQPRAASNRVRSYLDRLHAQPDRPFAPLPEEEF